MTRTQALIEIERVMNDWKFEVYENAKAGLVKNKEKIVSILEELTTEDPEAMEMSADLMKAYNAMGEMMMNMFAMTLLNKGEDNE